MQAAQICLPGSMEIVEAPRPECGPDEALVRVAWCGVCGTDVHILHGGFRADYPLIAGHEFAGLVEAVGSQVRGLHPGQRVSIDPNIVCGQCVYCRRGLVHFCQRLTAVGVNRPGGFAQWCAVPAAQLHRLPPRLTFAQAAFCEPLACVLHGVDRSQVGLGERALVLGAGPIGLLMAQVLRLAGAQWVAVSEPVASKRELALALGADEVINPAEDDPADYVCSALGLGVDVAVECAGRPETAELAVRAVRRGGRVVLFGVCDQDARLAVAPYDLFINELTVLGSYINPFTQARALDLLGSGLVRVDELIGARYPLERAPEALAAAAAGGSLKILVGSEPA